MFQDTTLIEVARSEDLDTLQLVLSGWSEVCELSDADVVVLELDDDEMQAMAGAGYPVNEYVAC